MNKFESMSFRKDFVLPIEEQDRMLGFIKWGKKNDYPYFLVDLYNGSAWHQGIIKNKTHYIAGGGLEVVSGELGRFIANPYSDFNMNEIVEQLAFDYELFGAFAVKGTWNREGTRVAVWEYLPIDAIRISSDERMYYLSDDWTMQQQSAEKTNLRTLPALDENNKVGSFVLYYKDPAKKGRKEHGVYPKPPYQGGITAIQTDVDISKFHMYELQNGFKSGTMITFVNGFPETQEEAEAYKNQIKGPASSIENSGDIIITFAETADQAPKVDNLTGNDLDKRYDALESSVQQNILVAHAVVSPSLFGVAPEGSFNAAESADLFEIFKNTYVNTRQKRIEWILNYMVKLSGDTGVIKLRDVTPLGTAEVAEVAPVATQPVAQETAFNRQDINALMDVVCKMNDGKISSESALTIIMTTYPHIDEAQARRIVGLQPGPQQLSSCKFDHQDDEIGYFAQYGNPAHEYDVIATFPIAWDTPSADVFSKQDQLFATIAEISAELNDFDKNVLKMIGDGEDSNAIAKALNSNIEDIAKSMARLMKWEVITKGEVTDLGKRLVSEEDIPIERFEVRYGYRTRLDVPPAKSGSRQFCERLMGLNRLYTRDEINTISGRVDRDVWKYRGGWYTNPDTQASTPWCRHEWIQQLVVKR
jgi:hypothetical protein